MLNRSDSRLSAYSALDRITHTHTHTHAPSGLQASTAMPRFLVWISPRYTGTVGFWPMKHDTMSVPPEQGENKKQKGRFRWLVGHVKLHAFKVCELKTNIQLPPLIRVGSQGQQAKQESLDFPVPSHFIQLFRGDPQAFPGASYRWDVPWTPHHLKLLRVAELFSLFKAEPSHPGGSSFQLHFPLTREQDPEVLELLHLGQDLLPLWDT